MTSPTGTFSVSGLLGGTAGQIDVNSLISSLMKAQSIPQSQLQDQLTGVQSRISVYQTINTKVTALQTAAQDLTAATTWSATAATSSVSSVAAATTAGAVPGTTTFDVTRLAQSQVTLVSADANGMVVTTQPAGITITGADGTSHAIVPASGSAVDVAKAVNAANVGVYASVITTDQGTMLQLSGTKSGATNSFTTSGFDATPNTVVAAQDAQVSVGGASGYTVSSPTNTFGSFIPGVTFTVSALASNATITVANDTKSIGDKVSALVTALNSAVTETSNDTGVGATLQGSSDVRDLLTSLRGTVANGTAGGGSLYTYGISIAKDGTFTFDATKFAAAYASDPTGTQSAISGFASSIDDVSTQAVDPTTGTITASISGLGDQGTKLTGEIGDWTNRLSDIQAGLQAKFTAMETALARLQSQQTYLNSMFGNTTSKSSSS